MPDWKDNNELPDQFSDLIRRKVLDYKVPVDDGEACWAGIEQRLPSGAKKKSLWRIGRVAAAIAAVAIIALLIIPLGNEENNLPLASSDDLSNTVIKENKPALTPENTQMPDEAKPSQPGITNNQPKTYLVDNNNTVDKQIEEILNTIDTTRLANIPDEILSKNIPENEPEKSDPKPDVQSEKKTNSSLTTSQSGRLLIPAKDKKTDGWLLAASVSSGNTVSGANTFNRSSSNPQYMDASNVSREPLYEYQTKAVVSEEEFSDFDYNVPLSFGVTVRKELTDHLAVETGLVYTYLSTKMKRKGSTEFQARQEIHYLGVPVNLVVYLWKDPKWNVYVSAGAAAEKGLRGVYTQDVYANNKKTADIKEKGSVDGLQWSLNASAGISYSVSRDWAVYAEPKVSYYFDNKQPISIRTDKSAVFGLGAGLRYQF